ncbi:MAG: ABC transporter permease [Gemmobacter sp.]
MSHAFFLAFAYLRHHRLASLALILSVALIASVPIATRLVLREAEASFGARADATPLILGARGSSLDLTMASLYFSHAVAGQVSKGIEDSVWDSGLADAIPLYMGFSARGVPVVGTSVDYFDFRDLRLDRGRSFALIGEAVLGAVAAKRLDIAPGDTLITDPGTLFDLAGSYPLELTVSGVLSPTGTADDSAVFVDVNTAWIIAGIGHGHGDVTEGSEGPTVIADPALRQFTRITPENIASFHLHQQQALLPLSAVIVVPHDERAEAILLGRYLASDNPLSLVRPRTVIAELLQTLFRIGALLDAVVVVLGLASGLAIALALAQAVQLRRDEVQTLFRLGAQRSAIARVIGAQFVIIFVAGLVVAATFLLSVAFMLNDIVASLVATAA